MSESKKIAGKEDDPNSSRVLRPPGGSSSPIFTIIPNIPTADKNPPKNIVPAQVETTPTHSAKTEKIDTFSRVFNVPTQGTGNMSPPKAHSAYVVRNPITGDGFDPENPKKKGENPGKNLGKDADQTTTETAKDVQTSGDVRNPPGGKSSEYF